MILASYSQIIDTPIKVGTIFLILNKKEQIQGVKFEGITPDNFVEVSNPRGKKQIYSLEEPFILLSPIGNILS